MGMVWEVLCSVLLCGVCVDIGVVCMGGCVCWYMCMWCGEGSVS